MDLEVIKTPNNTKLSRETARNLKYESMIIMRLLGVKYKEIASKTGLTEDHIKHLFAKGGVLFKKFEEAKANVGESASADAIAIMFANLPDIVRSMVLSAKQFGTPTGVIAGKTLLEYTLGRPRERAKTSATANYGTFAEWVKAESLKETQEQNGQSENARVQEGSE